MNKVIGIIILDYKLEKTREIKRLNTKWKIKEVLSSKNIELTDDLEIHIIEIPKVQEMLDRNKKDELAQWITFLDNPNMVEELKIMESNKEIKKAMEELEEISQDKELRRIAELKDKYIRDEKNMLSHAREDVQIEIASKLLKMSMSIEKISEVTGLDEKEIIKLKNNMQ